MRVDRIKELPIITNMVVTFTPKAVCKAMQPIDETVSPSMLNK